jgi:hypothetical protein
MTERHWRVRSRHGPLVLGDPLRCIRVRQAARGSTKPPDWLAASIVRLRLLIGKDEDEQKRRFYEALLRIDWLPSRVRGVILRELGSSLRQQQQGYAKGCALIRRHQIEEAKTRLRESGERRRGGLHNPAVDEVANRLGIESESLKRQLRRTLKPESLKKQLRRTPKKQPRHK